VVLPAGAEVFPEAFADGTARSEDAVLGKPVPELPEAPSVTGAAAGEEIAGAAEPLEGEDAAGLEAAEPDETADDRVAAAVGGMEFEAGTVATLP
jgi:hypothetical protein